MTSRQRTPPDQLITIPKTISEPAYVIPYGLYQDFIKMPIWERAKYIKDTSLRTERMKVFQIQCLTEQKKHEIEEKTTAQKLTELDNTILIMTSDTPQDKIPATVGNLSGKKDMTDQNLMDSVSGKVPKVGTVDLAGLVEPTFNYARLAIIIALIFLGLKYK